MFEAFNTPQPDEEELEDTWGRDILRELAEAGFKLAQAIQQEAGAEASKPASELAMTFSRVARAVRQTVALAVRQTVALEARIQRDDTVSKLRAQIPVPEIDFRDRMTRIKRGRHRSVVGALVGEQIEEQVSDPHDRDRLFDDLEDLLDTDNPRLDQPIHDLVNEVCQALGLKPAWSKWSQERWAQNLDLSAQTAQPPDG